MSMILCGRGGQLPFLTPEDLATQGWCCMADAEDGPAFCTCWEPVFDLEQREPDKSIEPATRRTRCHDCAYRPDSPERERGEDLEVLDNFWCHQGIRRPIAFVHADGRRREVDDSADYRPPMVGSVPYRADGRPADRGAGWAQAVRHRDRVPA